MNENYIHDYRPSIVAVFERKSTGSLVRIKVKPTDTESHLRKQFPGWNFRHIEYTA